VTTRRQIHPSLEGCQPVRHGNTSSATLLIALAAGLPVEALAGRGTGVDDEGLRHKIKVLRRVQALHQRTRCVQHEHRVVVPKRQPAERREQVR
jgi:hypothetical protein